MRSVGTALLSSRSGIPLARAGWRGSALSKKVAGAAFIDLMQVMPGTWQGIAPKLGVTSPWLVKDNIQAGICYDARMWAIWKDPRPLEERIAFTLASYNAGAGNILKAQRLVAGGEKTSQWVSVAARLHTVTGRSSAQTCGYVIRIQHLRECMLGHFRAARAGAIS